MTDKSIETVSPDTAAIDAAPVAADEWAKALAALAKKYTNGDTVAALRGIMMAAPIAERVNAINYRWADEEKEPGVRHIVINGIPYRADRVGQAKDGNALYAVTSESFPTIGKDGGIIGENKYETGEKPASLDTFYKNVAMSGGRRGLTQIKARETVAGERKSRAASGGETAAEKRTRMILERMEAQRRESEARAAKLEAMLAAFVEASAKVR